MTQPFLFLLLCLTSYRLWRIIGADDWPPSRALRAAIGRRVSFGATEELLNGETVALHAEPEGFWHEVRTLIECPWCLGFWISIAVVSIAAQLLVVQLPVLQALACSCVVGLIGSTLDD